MKAKEKKICLEDLRQMTEDTITTAIAGEVLGCTGHLLGRMCHDEPEKIGFPFQCVWNKTIIPRLGFINWMEGKSMTRYMAAAEAAGRNQVVVRAGDRILMPTSGGMI